MCTGNICRSPTAERLATAYATRHHIPNFSASSAGTHAVIGHPVHPEAVPELLRLGGDPADFAGRHLTAKIAATADLVLTMTRAHRDRVLELAPQKLNRTFTLPEAAALAASHGAQSLADLAKLRPQLILNDSLDIPDPIGQSPDVFAAVGQQIADLLPPVLELCRPQ
ncbi:MAG: low molecular weight phosphatase family protein [Rhodococcus sp. (in: high G+C Gram-positive bacteria)]|uniref:arsenate reductase/protein-tyrosine-phosphatase family protein n=1 Tax=Rhodococcus sp. TaxID=1831 RepID=UPI002AD7FB1E|nr:low molecular weight phosphatase family protein [Rhodococcus sp. (in: high G+C Gram-positive bacteria)]